MDYAGLSKKEKTMFSSQNIIFLFFFLLFIESPGNQCPYGHYESNCADSCLNSRCAGFPEAQCIVDPCTCDAMFMDVVSNVVVNCDGKNFVPMKE